MDGGVSVWVFRRFVSSVCRHCAHRNDVGLVLGVSHLFPVDLGPHSHVLVDYERKKYASPGAGPRENNASEIFVNERKARQARFRCDQHTNVIVA